ncbi:hypothetical protein Pla175_27470 [Pirellulimonas nuda]|uniref:Uncharacterized protein n=1 Tax=Pirellulimonas nuda TaxID=2528009 RepID=A0A518DCZ7_9BACT|nr:hypothetical protein [Pirellulimonas nuda]QDU89358.1 hypothetical protein Pla175_27470 [Pirellulimonas nuda]
MRYLVVFSCSIVAAAAMTGSTLASIAVQSQDGKIYSVATTGGSAGLATEIGSFTDVGPSTATKVSPNSLANYQGSFFRSDFAPTSGVNTLYKGNSAFLTPLDGSASNNEFAAGGMLGSEYHYIDAASNLRKVDVTAGVPTSTLVADLGTLGDFGDLAFGNGVLYVSHGTGVNQKLSVFDTLGNLLTSYDKDRYAGLAFDHGILYGVTGGASLLYEIVLGGADTFIAAVATAGGTAIFGTDAASAVPEVSSLLVWGSLLIPVGLSAGRRYRRRLA